MCVFARGSWRHSGVRRSSGAASLVALSLGVCPWRSRSAAAAGQAASSARVASACPCGAAREKVALAKTRRKQRESCLPAPRLCAAQSRRPRPAAPRPHRGAACEARGRVCERPSTPHASRLGGTGATHRRATTSARPVNAARCSAVAPPAAVRASTAAPARPQSTQLAARETPCSVSARPLGTHRRPAVSARTPGAPPARRSAAACSLGRPRRRRRAQRTRRAASAACAAAPPARAAPPRRRCAGSLARRASGRTACPRRRRGRRGPSRRAAPHAALATTRRPPRSDAKRHEGGGARAIGADVAFLAQRNIFSASFLASCAAACRQQRSAGNGRHVRRQPGSGGGIRHGHGIDAQVHSPLLMRAKHAASARTESATLLVISHREHVCGEECGQHCSRYGRCKARLRQRRGSGGGRGCCSLEAQHRGQRGGVVRQDPQRIRRICRTPRGRAERSTRVAVTTPQRGRQHRSLRTVTA